MLLFRERPDEVFHDIVREALASLAEHLKPAEVDPRIMAALLPKTAKMISGGEALATVDELILALASSDVFELAPMHRLILSETLERYCESYNSHPQDTDVHARYEIRHLDCARMINMFIRPFGEAFNEAPDQARMEAMQLSILGDASSRPPTRRDLSLWYQRKAVYPVPPPEM
jgi:hypothetical protein